MQQRFVKLFPELKMLLLYLFQEASLKLTKNLSQDTDAYRSTESSVSHHILDFSFEDNKKTLGTVLSSLPGASLKRKFSSDGDLQSLGVPIKIPRKGVFFE